MTVWKDTRKLATASAVAAVALSKGQTPTTTGTVKNGSKNLPAFIIPPVVDHEGELQAALQRLPEEERRSAVGAVQEVLQTREAIMVGAVPRARPRLPRRINDNRRGHDAPARAPRDLEELRLRAGADGRRLRGPPRRGDGARRRQRRRQVHADQVRRRHPLDGQRRGRSSTASRSTSTARRTPRSSGSRSSTRISRSATTSTSSRTCTSAARRTTGSSGSRSR